MQYISIFLLAAILWHLSLMYASSEGKKSIVKLILLRPNLIINTLNTNIQNTFLLPIKFLDDFFKHNNHVNL